MRRTLKPALALAMLLVASAARANGIIDMNWNDCGLYPSNVIYFGCNTSSGASNLLVSFVAPSGIAALGAVTIRMRIESPMYPDLVRSSSTRTASTYPSWWELGPGGCRVGAAEVLQPSPDLSCPSPWPDGGATGVLTSFTAPYGSSTAVRELIATIAPTDNGAYALDPGVEYAVASVRVSHAHTTGLGACGGCAEPMWLLLEEVDLHMSDGSPTLVLTQLAHSSGLGWQGDAPVPARSPTWGALKSLYR